MWLRAVAVWLGIIAVETVHGILRGLFLEPVLGSFRARQVSVFTASLLIFGVTWATVRWMDAEGRGLLRIGALWVALTLAFEVTLGRALGLGWARILEDYDILRGGLMPFGLLFMFLAPWLARKATQRRRGVPGTVR